MPALAPPPPAKLSTIRPLIIGWNINPPLSGRPRRTRIRKQRRPRIRRPWDSIAARSRAPPLATRPRKCIPPAHEPSNRKAGLATSSSRHRDALGQILGRRPVQPLAWLKHLGLALPALRLEAAQEGLEGLHQHLALILRSDGKSYRPHPSSPT